jgi:hypothetical protein
MEFNSKVRTIVGTAKTLFLRLTTFAGLFGRVFLVFVKGTTKSTNVATLYDPQFGTSVGHEILVVTDHHQTALEILNGLYQGIHSLHTQMVGTLINN